MDQSDIRCGYPPAASEWFEAPPYWASRNLYPCGIPLRAECDQWPFRRHDPVVALITVVGTEYMTIDDHNGLGRRDMEPHRCDPKIVAADQHAVDAERKVRGVD